MLKISIIFELHIYHPYCYYDNIYTRKDKIWKRFKTTVMFRLVLLVSNHRKKHELKKHILISSPSR